MRKRSLADHYQPLFMAGALAAHFSHRRRGFRPKDLRFLIELFSNWMEATIGDTSLLLQNVQVGRYLEQLRSKAWVKKTRAEGAARYELTRSGLTGLLSELVNAPSHLPLEQVFFVYYFLTSYGELFDSLLQGEESGLSRAARADLIALRDPQLVIQNQLRFLNREIKKLEARAVEAREAAALGEKILGEGGTAEQAAAEIQQKYPYELNSRKPLKELITEIPETLRPWEMTEGHRFRAEHLWVPLAEFLKQNRAVLLALSKAAK